MHRSSISGQIIRGQVCGWAAGGVLLLAVPVLFAPVLFAASKPQPPERNASVQLWLNTGSGNPCEQSSPASGEWTLRNKEDRTVLVTVHRTVTRKGATREDVMQDTLEPGESRELECELSEDGRASLTLMKAVY